jgi:hypothetical protein
VTCIGEISSSNQGLFFELFMILKLKSGISDFLYLTILNAVFCDIYELACQIANDVSR